MIAQCRVCRSEAHRMPRKTILDFVLSAVYIYPFRCKSCGHQFKQMQWGIRYIRQ
jgi:hypothetical protein